MTPEQTPILTVRELSYATNAGREILRGVTFDAYQRERIALVGANGAGKTTTLRCVARLVDVWRGDVLVDGLDVRSYARRELARRVAVVPQIVGKFGAYSVRQIVALGRLPYLSRLARADAVDDAIVEESLARVGASRFADRMIDTLSGGERQKALLAAAFAQRPTILLLDEPTTFLDYRSQSEISDAIDAWLVDYNAVAVEATHDLNRAAILASRVVALRNGAQVYCGDARESTEANALVAIYGEPLTTAPHPETGAPMILPRARAPESSRASQAFASSRVAVASSRVASRKLLATLAILTVLALAFLPLLGRTSYFPDVWLRFPTSDVPLRELDSAAKIFWAERMPKTALAALAGAGLALAGLALQTLFRNPLATPYTLGIASGSSFGATLAIYFSGALFGGFFSRLFGVPELVVFSGLGAALATCLVYCLSRRAQSQERVLLSGVVIGFFFSSLVLCFQFISNPTKTHVALHWTTGSLELCETRFLVITAIAVVLAFVALFGMSRDLDALTLGEERAASLGVDVSRARKRLFATSSALVGVIVAFCGPIGFVGLTAPHAARLLVGNTHRALVPGAALVGALFLATCYTASRVALFPVSLPVGIVTSLIGAPVFVWLVMRKG